MVHLRRSWYYQQYPTCFRAKPNTSRISRIHQEPTNGPRSDQKYTAGSREWLDWDGPLGLYRKRSKIYPRGRAGLEGEPTAMTKEFVRARMRYDQGVATPDDMKHLIHLERPKFQEVLEELENILV